MTTSRKVPSKKAPARTARTRASEPQAQHLPVPAPEYPLAESQLRVIKKYPNRRLYDTATSAYVTLAEVKDLVMSSERFMVQDAKTGEDLTRAILLQIILEQEAGGAPIFSEAVLANIIRFYGHAAQGFMGAYLERNIQIFSEMQHKLTERAKGAPPEIWANMFSLQSPMMQRMMAGYAEQTKTLLVQLQDQMNKQTDQMLGAFGIKRHD